MLDLALKNVDRSPIDFDDCGAIIDSDILESQNYISCCDGVCYEQDVYSNFGCSISHDWLAHDVNEGVALSSNAIEAVQNFLHDARNVDASLLLSDDVASHEFAIASEYDMFFHDDMVLVYYLASVERGGMNNVNTDMGTNLEVNSNIGNNEFNDNIIEHDVSEHISCDGANECIDSSVEHVMLDEDVDVADLLGSIRETESGSTSDKDLVGGGLSDDQAPGNALPTISISPEVAKILLEADFLTINEKRHMLGLEGFDNGDTIIRCNN